jgi:cytochrome P450
MHFARLQIEVAFSELLSRVTNLRIPDGTHVETAVGIVLGPEHLPVIFDIRQP